MRDRDAGNRTGVRGARPWLPWVVGGALLLAGLAALPAVVRPRRGAGDVEVLPLPGRNFGDWAGAVPGEWGAWLDDQLGVFEATTPARLVVAILPALPAGVPVESFTIRAAERWRPGLRRASNGLILFVFPVDRRARLEVGYGLEATLPDAAARRLLEASAVAHFKTGDYQEGIVATMEALRAAVAATPTSAGAASGRGRSAPARQLALLVSQVHRDWRQDSGPERARLAGVGLVVVAAVGWSLATIGRLVAALVRAARLPRSERAPWWQAPPDGAPDLAALRLAGMLLVLALGGLIAFAGSLGGFGGGGALVAW